MPEDAAVAATEFPTPPSVVANYDALIAGQSYSHYSAVPALVSPNGTGNVPTPGTPCVLGVDEAGRGPVIGPMIYGVYYLPIEIQQTLLTKTYHFDDSKALTADVRARLMKAVCSESTDLYESCGWAIRSLSARDIGAGMLKNGGAYNLNAQAMDATVELIRGVLEQGVNVTEIYVDTIGMPVVYQKKLERIFPTIKITVEKKADSLYPCVSAASVVAKVTRDVSCEKLFEEYVKMVGEEEQTAAGWGSGYPSDARCVSWLKQSVDATFGWGSECRFSWSTVKDMLDAKNGPGKRVDWPAVGDDDNMQLSSYFNAAGSGPKTEADELRTWFGTGVGQEAF
ncbi:ribonuclease HII [Cyphellophora europaea CBS 101466]|uniref:Ribonuclease n=1 Tax=Cyphellophora europaea (strain CBS 101466) TaxID=1220924 RepID=W2S6B4_CYPE1|nr:ribonuclease HII [Cyphellophora europaea CBS 101466]ETN44246.1 ribonuclease HII [Cyphellophora europaea CBS 101466]